jgi:drug/metabolite transporter (DMT)-like permease
VVIVLGVNWPILAIGLRDIPPIWMAAFRLGGGTLVILVATGVSGRLHLPPRSDLPIILSVAMFRLALVFVLVFTALRIVPPGRSSVLVWTASLWTVPLAAVFLGERMGRLRWVGLTIGVAGIVALFEPWRLSWSDTRVLTGHGLLLAAAVSNASAAVHIRRHRWTATPLEALPWQLAVATLPLLGLAFALEGLPRIDWTAQLAWIVAYQGILATGLAVWAQISVLRNLAAVSTNLTLMAVPVIGLFSSAIIVGEQLTTPVLIGVAMILLGVGLNIVEDRRQAAPPLA